MLSMKRLPFLVFGLFYAVTADITCPSGWGKWRNKCYWAGRRSNFEANKQVCIEKNAELVSIENAEENSAVLSYIRSANQRGDHWLSAKRIRLGENKFQWGDGRLFTYTNWWPGEPAEIHKESAACVIIGSDGRWWDVPCEETRSQLCQIVAGKTYNQFNLTDYLLNNTAVLSTRVDNNTYTIQALNLHVASILQGLERNFTKRIEILRNEVVNEMSKQSAITLSKLNKFVAQQHRSEALTAKQQSAATKTHTSLHFVATLIIFILNVYN